MSICFSNQNRSNQTKQQNKTRPSGNIQNIYCGCFNACGDKANTSVAADAGKEKPAKKPMDEAKIQQAVERLVSKYDTDGDGMLSPAELKTAAMERSLVVRIAPEKQDGKKKKKKKQDVEGVE